MKPLHELWRGHRRPNAADAEWTPVAEEIAWRAHPPADPAGALVDALALAEVDEARWLLWLALEVVPDEELPRVAAGLSRIADPDARVLATFQLLGRAASAPPWLVAAIRQTLAGPAKKASKNLEPSIEILGKAVDEPARFSLEGGLAAGARLFAEGKFFEAHEAWEDVWRPMRTAERDFWRGLINLAVAMSKGAKGNPNGVVRLIDRADGLLAPYEPAHRGVDVASLRRAMAHLKEQAREWRAGRRNGIDPPPKIL